MSQHQSVDFLVREVRGLAAQGATGSENVSLDLIMGALLAFSPGLSTMRNEAIDTD